MRPVATELMQDTGNEITLPGRQFTDPLLFGSLLHGAPKLGVAQHLVFQILQLRGGTVLCLLNLRRAHHAIFQANTDHLHLRRCHQGIIQHRKNILPAHLLRPQSFDALHLLTGLAHGLLQIRHTLLHADLRPRRVKILLHPQPDRGQ